MNESGPYYALVTAALYYEPATNLYRSKDGIYYKKIEDIPGSARAKFKKVFSPYYSGEPVIGKRADTIIIDDVPTMEQSASKLREEITKMFLYGDPKINWTYKEKEMEIGGNRCHLCGAEVLHASDNSTYLKKRVVSEKHLVYQCGTQILETKKAKYIYCSDSGRQEPEFERHIHAECI